MKQITTLDEAKEIIAYQYQEMTRLSQVIQQLTEELSLAYNAKRAKIIGRAPSSPNIIDLEERRRLRAGYPPF